MWVIVRRAWLAGSLPGTTPIEAMTLALDALGPSLYALPSGETSRPQGIISLIDELAKTSLFTVRKHGDVLDGAPVDYDNIPQLSVIGDMNELSLGYADLFEQESTIARELIVRYGLALSLQVGIPSPYTVANMALGSRRALRWMPYFTRALVRDIIQIYMMDETALFSLEIPLELCAVLNAPAPLRAIAMRTVIKRITDWISQCPTGMRIGVHPCLGDLQHVSRCHLPRLGLLIDFVNELVRHWPRGYTLAYIHLPLAEGNLPPVTDTAWYTSATRLSIPKGTRLIAGVCHEFVDLEEIEPVIRLLDTLTRQEVMVGASCGLAPRGTRTAETSRTILRQQRELCAYVS